MLVDLLVENIPIFDRLHSVADPRNPRLPNIIQQPHATQAVQRDLELGRSEVVSAVAKTVAHQQQAVEDEPRKRK